MNQDVKTIKEDISRARSYAGKLEIVKSLKSLCDALKLLTKSQIFGRDKFEIGTLTDEVLRILSATDEIKAIFPKGIGYKKGQEKNLLKTLTRLHDSLEAALERAKVEAMRKEKNSIDHIILSAQENLDKKEYVEAKKLFRKACDKFPDEWGIYQDCGVRLLKAGQLMEALEFLEQGISKQPNDSRSYVYRIMVYEAVGELDKALDAVNEVLRKFGPNESIYLRLSKIYVQLRRWSEAYDAANEALRFNPFSPEANKIIAKVTPRIYGKGYKHEPGKTPPKKAVNLDSSGGKKDAAEGGKNNKKPGRKAIKLDF